MTKHLHIAGVVQGVGYRAAFAATANALQLSGWVRNRVDGSVEAVVSGPAEAVDSIIDWAWRGPSGAQVREVSVVEIADTLEIDKKFEILPTE